MHAIAPSVSSGHVRLHSARPRPPRPRAEARQRTTKTLPTRQRRRRHDALVRAFQRAEVQCPLRSVLASTNQRNTCVKWPCISGRGGRSDECGTKDNLLRRRRFAAMRDLARPMMSAFRRTTEQTSRENAAAGAVPISPHLPGGRGGTVSPDSAHDSAQLVEERPWM